MHDEEFYIVAAKRLDGGVPSLVKAVWDKMFPILDEAKAEAKRLNKEYKTADLFRVYLCGGSTLREEL